MSTSTKASASADGRQDFPCGTPAINDTQGEPRTATIIPGLIMAVSHERVEVYIGVDGAPGATIEAQWPDEPDGTAGKWTSIGSVRDNGELFNPDVPSAYLVDSEHIRLRIEGMANSEVTLPINPIITSLSSSLNPDGSISVSGTTTLQNGRVEAFCDGQWKSIGDFSGGVFSNPNVPADYVYGPQTMRVHVLNDTGASADLDSTLGFPHARTVLMSPKIAAADEQRLMQWRWQKADYQPTGYFAPANTDVEVWAWGNVENLTLLVGTQGMADLNDPSKQSESMRPTRLARGMNIIRDPLGGTIHIRKLAGSSPGFARIVFRRGAKPIPYYVNGVTAPQWRHMLETSDAPEVEMVGEHIVVAAFRSTALKFANVDPADVIASHETVVALESEVSGLDGSATVHTRSPLLLYAVESLSLGNPHATTGYIGLPYRPDISEYSEALIGGLAAHRWVTYHEYGHHFQTPSNSYGPFGEVSVNLYGFAVGRHFRHEYTDEFPQRWPATQRFLQLPRPEKHYGAEDSDAQAIFEQLRKGLGEHFLPQWHRYIRENPGHTPGLKWFVVSACIAAQHNLSNFFADWGLLKLGDTDVWDAVAALNLPYPPVLLATIRPYVD
jgi:hypothetical protein